MTATFEIVKSVRREILADIMRSVDEASGILEAHDAYRIRPPAALIGGEWDWYWHLTRPERNRLRKGWMSDTADGPDLIADRFHLPVDEAMAEWLRCTRIIDAARSMQIRKSGGGYVPGSASLGGDIDDLFPHPIYQLTELFSPQPSCVWYLAEVSANEDETREEATWETSRISISDMDTMDF